MPLVYNPLATSAILWKKLRMMILTCPELEEWGDLSMKPSTYHFHCLWGSQWLAVGTLRLVILKNKIIVPWISPRIDCLILIYWLCSCVRMWMDVYVPLFRSLSFLSLCWTRIFLVSAALLHSPNCVAHKLQPMSVLLTPPLILPQNSWHCSYAPLHLDFYVVWVSKSGCQVFFC